MTKTINAKDYEAPKGKGKVPKLKIKTINAGKYKAPKK